jgi:four helix bundle protein
MDEVKSFRDLIVWQKSMDLATAAYQLARKLPKSEEYRLTNQLLRAAASIPANIAEGHGRGTRKDYAQFISIAYGSLAETETHLLLLSRIGLVQEQDVTGMLSLCREVGRMLNALRHRLREPRQKPESE